MENKAYDNIVTRSSVRKYQPGVAVSDTDRQLIMRAAMAAPSGVNRQPWEFVVIDDPDVLARLADALPYAKMAAKAPLAIVVCGDSTRFLDGEDDTLWVQDLSAVSENILLAAHALGYGGVWTCLYPHAERQHQASTILQLPDTIIPFNLIPIGVPDGKPRLMDKWDPTRIHYNRWQVSKNQM